MLAPIAYVLALISFSPVVPDAPMLTTEVRLDTRTRIIIRHVDADKFDATTANSTPAVTLAIYIDGKQVSHFDIAGRKGWRPWGLGSVRVKDMDGDGVPEALVESWSNFGGSGSMLYLTIAGRDGGRAVVADAPATTAENIQTGEYLLARYGAKRYGLVVTEPLMDAETRPDPTHWRVRCVRYAKGKISAVSTRKTSQRYAETVPPAVLSKLTPSGWRLAR